MNRKKIALALCLLGLAGAAYADNHPLARNLAAACASCHGTGGHSVGGMGRLAGMPKDELVRRVKDFRSGATPATVMHQLSKGYSDQQIELIADYYAAQPK